MFQGKRVSVVFSTYREKGSIRQSIEEYLATGLVDELIVVNNNAEPGTDEEVRATDATLIYETKQGYGWGYRKGIEAATGDYVVLSEPDGTFTARDLEKFLVYAKDFPVVIGSRTNQSTILEGSKMGLARKLANVLTAKMLEVLFNTNALTEVGCTYKCFRRDVLDELSHYWETTDALFATELLLLVVARRIPFVEIPISFAARVGVSSLTATFKDLVYWGLRIQGYIVKFWLRWLKAGRKLLPRR